MGLRSYAAAGVTVVSDIADIDTVPVADRYIVVSQTTQDREQFAAIVEQLEKRFSDVTVFNTICDSTHNRQSDIRDAFRGTSTRWWWWAAGSRRTPRDLPR